MAKNVYTATTRQFSWAGLVASAVSGGAAAALTGSSVGRPIGQTTGSVTKDVVSGLVRGELNREVSRTLGDRRVASSDAIFEDAFGNAIGNVIAGNLGSKPIGEAEPRNDADLANRGAGTGPSAPNPTDEAMAAALGDDFGDQAYTDDRGQGHGPLDALTNPMSTDGQGPGAWMAGNSVTFQVGNATVSLGATDDFKTVGFSVTRPVQTENGSYPSTFTYAQTVDSPDASGPVGSQNLEPIEVYGDVAPPPPTLTFNPVFTSYVGSQGLPTIPVDRHLAPPVDPGSLDRSLHIDVGQEKVNPYLARPEGLAPDDAWNDLPFVRIAQVEVSAVRGFRDGIEALPGRFDSMAKSLLAIKVTPQDVEHAMEATTDFALHANARVNSALAAAPEAVTKNLSEKYAQGAKYVHDTPADTIAYDVGYQTAYHSPDIVAAIATDGLSAGSAAAGGSMRILATKGESWALESVATRELASGTIDEAAAAARAQAEHTAREAVQETLTEARVPSTTAVDATSEVGAGNNGIPPKLYHYTNEAGMQGILDSETLNPSLKAINPNDVRYGNGQYLSDIAPGTMTPAQLSRAFINNPFQGARYTNFIEIDTTGLNVIQGRPGVYVIPNEVPLDLSGRITNSGQVLGQ